MKTKSIILMSMLTLALSSNVMAYEQSEIEGQLDWELSDESLIFSRYDLSEDYEGNPMIVLEFDYTNNSSEGKYAINDFSIQVYQGGVEQEMAFAAYQGEYEELSNNLAISIKDGASLPVASCYGLKDLTAPVEITELGSWEKITATIESF